MIKTIGLWVIGIVFFTTYIGIGLKLFAGSESGVIYVKSEFSFGSMTLIGSFLVMTILVFILGNYLIDSVVKRLNKK